MRRVLRVFNLVAGALCLASGGAALWSWLVDPAYRAAYGDSVVVLVAYVVFYAWVLRSFWRDDAWAPRLAVLKALGAYVFLATFVAVGPAWMVRTPGRYVYQLFQWGPGEQAVLMAYVLLGRGVWNTVNAMAFTAPWWTRLRADRPLLGRLVTLVPLVLIVTFLWAYRELIRLERETFSAEATAVAQEIAEGIDCAAIRDAPGPTTTDLRQRGDRRYEVHIRWACHDLQVLVRDPEGRLGNVRTARPECCAAPTTS
jgi:hypothetical protein